MKLRKKMLCMVKQVKKITIFACLVCVVYPIAGIQAAVGEQQSVAQTLKKIKGKVIDVLGEPLIGVNVSSFSFIRLTTVPSICTTPASGSSKVPIICNNVVLPAPLGPTILTISPLLISRSMPFNTCNEPKLFVIPSSFIIIAL